MTPSLKGKTIVITGASRGIGREIALKAAADGANLVLAAKTVQEDVRLPGTIDSVAAEVEAAGGKALPVQVDVRNEEQVTRMVEAAVKAFGGIDALVNNAGAVALTSVEETPMKRFDLMHQVNVRAVFLCSRAVLPHLKNSANPHILNLSPPLSGQKKWYGSHLAYTISKYGMTMCTLGMAEEFARYGIAVNSLWPHRLIATAATRMLLGEQAFARMRKPAIMAEAAYAILTTSSRELTGQCLIDEELLRGRGETEFDKYSISKSSGALELDLFMDV